MFYKRPKAASLGVDGMDEMAAHVAIQLDPDPDSGLGLGQPDILRSIDVGIEFAGSDNIDRSDQSPQCLQDGSGDGFHNAPTSATVST